MFRLSTAFAARQQMFSKREDKTGLIPQPGMPVVVNVRFDSHPETFSFAGVIVDVQVAKCGIVSAIIIRQGNARVTVSSVKTVRATLREDGLYGVNEFTFAEVGATGTDEDTLF